MRENKGGGAADEQTYGLGVKEVWQVPETQFKKGYIQVRLEFWCCGVMYGVSFSVSFVSATAPGFRELQQKRVIESCSNKRQQQGSSKAADVV